MIHPLAVIGEPPEHRDYRPGMACYAPLISKTARVEALCTVDAGLDEPSRVGARSWLMKGVHVGHDAQIGEDCELAPHCSVGGHVKIGDRVRVGQGATFKPFVTVGDDARIGMGAVVVKDVPAGETWVGNPARPLVKGKWTGTRMTEIEEQGWDELATKMESTLQYWQRMQ